MFLSPITNGGIWNRSMEIDFSCCDMRNGHASRVQKQKVAFTIAVFKDCTFASREIFID